MNEISEVLAALRVLVRKLAEGLVCFRNFSSGRRTWWCWTGGTSAATRFLSRSTARSLETPLGLASTWRSLTPGPRFSLCPSPRRSSARVPFGEIENSGHLLQFFWC